MWQTDAGENLDLQVAAQVGISLVRASCARVSGPSLVLEYAGGCRLECRQLSADDLAVGLFAEDGNDVHTPATVPL